MCQNNLRSYELSEKFKSTAPGAKLNARVEEAKINLDLSIQNESMIPILLIEYEIAVQAYQTALNQYMYQIAFQDGMQHIIRQNEKSESNATVRKVVDFKQ
jgi:hypothetical protein